ncbi:MAG: hypothetical protein HRT64_14915 [Erythrobacter sp.]|nr:hypothetical protein [Erythrobacter sp.]
MIDFAGLQPLMGKWSPSKAVFYLVMLALAALLGFYAWNEAKRLSTAASFETAQIIRFVGNGKGAVVLTREGEERIIRGRASNFAGCLAGGEIRLERRGDEYRVAIDGCNAG